MCYSKLCLFPDSPLIPPYLSNGITDILVNCIGHLCSLHTAAKLHVQDTRVVSQPPVISFVTRKTCAVDTRLLSRSDTNNLKNTTTLNDVRPR